MAGKVAAGPEPRQGGSKGEGRTKGNWGEEQGGTGENWGELGGKGNGRELGRTLGGTGEN